MPRRLPIRPAVLMGNFFVLMICVVMATIYYAYTHLVWLPKIKRKSSHQILKLTAVIN